MKTYEEGAMQLAAQTFQMWANELPEKVLDKNGFKQES